MEIQEDFKELLELFNAGKVEYLIVGGDTPTYFISKADLITNKRSLGRRKDLADLEALGQE